MALLFSDTNAAHLYRSNTSVLKLNGLKENTHWQQYIVVYIKLIQYDFKFIHRGAYYHLLFVKLVLHFALCTSRCKI